MSKHIPSVTEQITDLAFEAIDDLLMELLEQHKSLQEAAKLTFAQGDWGSFSAFEQEEREIWRTERKIEDLGYYGHRFWRF